jgi:tRNA-dihydrouridine synthase
MLTYTGCSGIAIGRGALLNPWFFAQLARWESTGEPGPAASYAQRLELMDRHFHLLVEHQSERFACLSFRKVANWYCRVLKPGHEIQQQMMMIASVAHFEELVERIGAILAARAEQGQEWPEAELSIRVPQGPIEHW